MAMSRDLGLSLVHKGTQLVKLKISKLLRFWIFNVGHKLTARVRHSVRIIQVVKNQVAVA